jgi:hypothetical protein
MRRRLVVILVLAAGLSACAHDRIYMGGDRTAAAAPLRGALRG